MLRLHASVETWPVRGVFRIARSAETQVDLVVVRLEDDDGVVGRGEGRCYPRLGATPASVLVELGRALPPRSLRASLEPGPARCALDCALWDLRAKRLRARGEALHERLGLAPPAPLATSVTVSLDTPDAMAEVAARHTAAGFAHLKLKVSGDAEDTARVRAVRDAAPMASLIVDANESWSMSHLEALMPTLASARVSYVEQPLPADRDEALTRGLYPVPVCADESCAGPFDLARVSLRYDAVCLKLDKAGGLTTALAMLRAAQALDLRVMVSCMVSTSLAIAPALLLAAEADWVDLDAPLLLARDRPHGLHYADGEVQPASPALWG